MPTSHKPATRRTLKDWVQIGCQLVNVLAFEAAKNIDAPRPSEQNVKGKYFMTNVKQLLLSSVASIKF